MLSDFTYTMISEGYEIINHPNAEFDFQTHAYEVCLLDMMFMPGAWDNIRDGGNLIEVREDEGPITQLYLPPGHYNTKLSLAEAINTLIVGHGRFLTENISEQA